NGLEKGYASASTDTGHQGTATDASWALNNPAKRIDFAYRGTHVTAATAKALSQAYYGSAPRRAYFNGCSNGGRQALMEAQRYPEDFDGIIAGDPSFGTMGQIRRTLVYQKLLSAGHFLSAAKISTLAKAVLDSCDAQDGLADGLITDPRLCTFRPESLKCAGADAPNCLTSGELETVNAIHGDLKGPGGRMLVRFPLGHEDGATGWQAWVTGASDPQPRADNSLALTGRSPAGYSFQDGYLKYLAFEGADGTFDWRTFDLDRDGPKVQPFMDVFSPTSPDLSKLRSRGGKLILYHGWADPALSALVTIAYYDDVVKKAGGRQQSDRFVELFMAPGMHHCQGTGPGPNRFDMVTALDEWVDKGTAPTRVVATHATNGVIDRTRPLCPYPQVAKYTGRGSVDAAENFQCVAAEALQQAAAAASEPRVASSEPRVARSEPRVARSEPRVARSEQRAPSPASRVASYAPPKTPWGDPDLQGNYTNKYEYGTPFERPREFEGRRLEDVSARELSDALKKRQEDTLERAKFFGGDPEGKIGNSAEFRDIYEVSKGSRAWLVVDPPEGKIPQMTAAGQARVALAARAGSSFGNGPFNGPEDFSLWERCISRGFPGSMLPGVYGNSYQVVQGPGFVAIRYEMIHETRVIRLDGLPHPPKGIRLDMGDARGHWEGNTLVVETTNFTQRSAYRNANAGTLRLTERFTPKAAGTLEWSLTVEDPETWTRPWTFSMPLTANDAERIEQYECHEGNHAVFNILSATRTAEREAAGATAK
ncbi:MAG TPA: tannase/feruloyl esterase family alpha/beta hydrolase, partial [Vicinamibacterales bacterium]|nr:tannase/feruloyl esterase family alpha/beta hydrolase [Vicinamibacterales bacterium]